MRKYTVWARGDVFNVRGFEGLIVVRFPVTLFPLNVFNSSGYLASWHASVASDVTRGAHVRHAVICNLHG